MIYSLIKLSLVLFILINTIGFFKHYTSNFWTKTKGTKELTISNCEYVFKEINDINHFVKAKKIKVHEHLGCKQRVNLNLRCVLYSLKKLNYSYRI